MPSLQQQGVLTPWIAKLGEGEVHNDILSKASQMGLFGLLSIVAIYAVPAWLFARVLRLDDPGRRIAGQMGLALVCAFFMDGLTVEMFDLTMMTAFYALTVTVLLACAYPRRLEAKTSAQ